MRHSCMGGWCAVRENCRHYHALWRDGRDRPVERLCETVKPNAVYRPDPHDAFEPVRESYIPIREAA